MRNIRGYLSIMGLVLTFGALAFPIKVIEEERREEFRQTLLHKVKISADTDKKGLSSKEICIALQTVGITNIPPNYREALEAFPTETCDKYLRLTSNYNLLTDSFRKN